MDRGALAVAKQGERLAVRIPGRVTLGLPAGLGQRLGEIAVPVQQPHADQRHAEIAAGLQVVAGQDRKSTRLNSSHEWISYAVFCLKKKKKTDRRSFHLK